MGASQIGQVFPGPGEVFGFWAMARLAATRQSLYQMATRVGNLDDASQETSFLIGNFSRQTDLLPAKALDLYSCI